MQRWQIESNIEAFGHYEAARIMRKRGFSFEVAYAAIFGRAPRK